MRIHLDLLGGLAGDMFIAGLLDAFPAHETGMLASIRAASVGGQSGPCRLVTHRDAVLVGRRFEVDVPTTERGERSPGPDQTRARTDQGTERLDHAHPHGHDHAHAHAEDPARHRAGDAAAPAHDHTRWQTIRARLTASDLSPPVLAHALGIFALLAAAEAHVHGVAVDDVAFHEVGAWDSIADIVGAAHLIAAIGATQWQVSAIPLGFGRVNTAHGPMPVPAPATAQLLAGFATIDDGIGGERVTPTGAALIRYLCEPPAAIANAPGRPRSATLHSTGIGFGTRVLPGIGNCVRVLVFDESVAPSAVPASASQRQLAVIEFEVDDQSAEDLAMGLDHLRAHEAVFDVVQAAVFGKKNRMMTAVRVLAAPASLAAVVEACFRETTTIGLRHHLVDGAVLPRHPHDVKSDPHVLRVKSVERPGGATAKAEADDVAAHPGHATRQAMRARAQGMVIDELEAHAAAMLKRHAP